MARSKRKQKPRKSKDDDDKEEVYDEPDPEKDEYFQDEVDKFHADREKILLDSTADHDQQGESDHNNDMYQDDEMMLLDVEESDIDDDSDDDAEEDGDKDNKEEGDKDEASEEDESESENEKDQSKGIPSQKSWGRKKDAFYDADIVEEYAGSDEEMDKLAEEEEEEALALQKQMAAALEEQDFDTAAFELPQTVQEKNKDESHQEKIIQDLSKLSKAEKIEILIKDSPELFHLLDEFKLKLKEVIEKLHPLVNMARAGRVPQQGANYLELKHQLYLNYCINIGFYLLLKAKQTPVRNHPVIGRLVQYGKLIKELEPLDKKVELELEILLSQRQSDKKNGLQDNIDKESAETTAASRSTGKQPTKLSALLDGNSDSEENDKSESNKKSKKHKTSNTEQMLQSIENKKKGKKSKRKLEEPSESMDPLAYYEAVKLQKKKRKEAKKAVVGFSDELDLDQDDPGKRGITYEISKNKGLTAKKKKELQNPRVKHRRKFFKAQIKRKSQVRPVVNEQNRYGGEMTGIRSHLTRSTKIK